MEPWSAIQELGHKSGMIVGRNCNIKRVIVASFYWGFFFS